MTGSPEGFYLKLNYRGLNTTVPYHLNDDSQNFAKIGYCAHCNRCLPSHSERLMQLLITFSRICLKKHATNMFGAS